MLIEEQKEKRIGEIQREYLPTLLSTNDRTFVYNGRRRQRQCSVELSWEKEQIFFLFFYFFSSVLLLLFGFQFSIFFSLPIPFTNIIIADRQADWLSMYRKDMYTHHTLTFWTARSFLSSFVHSFTMINDFFKCSLYFIVCMLCSSNVTLTVCFKRMFPLTVPPTPCWLRIIIKS